MHMLMRHHTHLHQKIGSTVWLGRNLCKLAKIHTLPDALECGPGGIPGAGHAAQNMRHHPASALPASPQLMQGNWAMKRSVDGSLVHAEEHSCSREGRGVFDLCSGLKNAVLLEAEGLSCCSNCSTAG